MQTMRIRNLSYALTRLCALVGALCVLGALGWLAWVSDAERDVIALAVLGPSGLVAWAFYSLARAPWWLEARAEGLRVRYLLAERRYPWGDILETRLTTETTYIDLGIPFFRHRVLVFLTSRGKRVLVCLDRSEVRALDGIDGFDVGPDGWVPLWRPGERGRGKQDGK